MPETKQLTLPITGMYCANCVSTIERNLKKVNGVQSAVVNLSSERAIVQFNPSATGLDEMIARVQRAGYGIAMGEADLIIKRLADDSDARRTREGFAKSRRRDRRASQHHYGTCARQVRADRGELSRDKGSRFEVRV